ncbi:MAG TPA: hypothetical protein PKM65_06875 [Spirochaetota bacterium]|nr:hypothetical protein [Spirochaetota bacterium]HNT09919.1 hypothetical protein [Spirochaetota bacterium]HNV45872.1 hypothetical protein [Spirochaetota bacterium]HPU88071.1 hypothetical protein [Spirochaetota bacterium]
MRLPNAFTATAIGSFPHDNPEQPLDIIFASMPDAPVWPQLPKTGALESMEIQYAEGMPRAVIDTGKSRLHFDTSGDYSEDFADFYERYMTLMESGGDFGPLAIGPAHSKGIYALEKRLQAAGKKHPFVKVQVTGPCSFSLTVTDENKRALYYNEEFRDVIAKAIALKSRWQIRKFAPYAEQVICFVDEPILSAFGSSTYIAVKRDDVIALLAEQVEAIHADGALAGIHCCGNTEWSIPVEAGFDIINFDAYAYGETIALYPDAMKQFIGRGGVLAWGIVPTSEAIRSNDAASLADRFGPLAADLAKKAGIDLAKIYASAMVTPSCGTGSLPVADAVKVFEVLKALPGELRTRY